MNEHSKEWAEGYRNGKMNVSRFGNAWAATVCLWKTPENDYDGGYQQAIQEACEAFNKRRCRA